MAGLVIDNDCAQHVQAPIERQIVTVESSFNPYAIGVVDGRLERQPRNKAEALATAQALQAQGWNFSLGCRQVNVKNLGKYGLTLETAFDAEKNSAAGKAIYSECMDRASKKFGNGEAGTRAALSCYYSGNFTTGQRKEGIQPSYVGKVLGSAIPDQQSATALAIPVIASKAKGTGKVGAKTVSVSTPRPKVEKEQDDWDVFHEL